MGDFFGSVNYQVEYERIRVDMEKVQCELAKANEENEYLRCKCRELDRINEILQAQMDVVKMIFNNRG